MTKTVSEFTILDHKESAVMKNILSTSFFLITLLFLAGCGPTIKVGYDYETDKDFASFKTFDFLTNPDYCIRKLVKKIQGDIMAALRS
jgi:hypothetical protein